MINQSISVNKSLQQFDQLPYGYAVKAVKMLRQQGLRANKSQVIDIKRGKLNSHNLTIPVLKVLRKLQKAHIRELKKINELRAA
jgi:hypothetical protein